MTSIKVVSAFTAFLEVGMVFQIASTLYNYSQIVSEMDLIVQVGSDALLITSLMTLMSAMMAYSYARDRTDRTPENKQNTMQFMTIVSMFNTAITLVMVNLIEKHVTESAAYASLKGIEFTSAVEVTLAEAMDDYVDG